MKHIDYLYFNIYNYFYRSSLDSQNANARIQAMYMFSVGLGGWLLLLESVYLHLIKHARFTSPLSSMIFASSLYLLTAVLFNYIFIVKDRDQKIFGEYEEFSNQNPKQKIHFVVSIIILLMPYAGLVSFAVFFPRHNA